MPAVWLPVCLAAYLPDCLTEQGSTFNQDPRVKLAIRIGVTLAILVVVFLVVPWDQMAESLRRLPPGVWGLVLVGFVASHSLGITKWRRFVSAGRATLGVLDATLCYAAGLFANLCLPTIVGGDVLRMGLASRVTKRPEAALWGGIMDRVSDIVALALLVGAGGVLARGQLKGWTSQLLSVLLVATVLIVGLALPLLIRRPLRRWPRRFRRPIARSLLALRRMWRDPSVAIGGFALSIVMQSGLVLLNAWLGRELGIKVDLAVWFFAWPLAKIASLVPISLGGLAVREASLAVVLLPFGVPAAASIVASLVWQTVLISGGLLGGLVWLILSRWRHVPAGLHPERTAASVSE